MQGNEALKNENAVNTPKIQSVARPIQPDEIGTEASRALNTFLESAAHVGLDSKAEHFRNFTQLMLELKGADTGMDLSHLVHDEHSGLAMDDTTERKLAKKRKKKWLQEDLDEIARQEAEMMMAQLMESAVGVIDKIQKDITKEINALNAKIDAEIEQDGKTNQAAVNRMRKKRNKLRAFKKHIKAHKEELKEAEHHDDIIDTTNDVVEDLKDFRAGRFDPQEDIPYKRNALAQAISDMTRKPKPANNTHKPTPQHQASNQAGKGKPAPGNKASPYGKKRPHTTGTSSSGSSGSDETGSSGKGGEGNADGKHEPPPMPEM